MRKIEGYPWMDVLYSDIGDNFVLAFPDQTTDGEDCWIAVSVKYDGVLGQGWTADEAIEDCRLAITDFIELT